ncbi:MAG TPA: hypothetical protein VFG05_02935 [Methylocella sp.]|nr:hypothetical protein [Methylocella sp.]
MHHQSVVHIGFHRTGSTSIQAFCWRFRRRLAKLGIAMYEGWHRPANHVELHVGAMRPERMTPFKFKAGLNGGPSYRRMVEQRLSRFIGSASQDKFLFSAEGLSYLREEDELAWLRNILPGKAVIVACLRDPAEYLRSYRLALMRHGIAESSDPDSIAYTRAGSWLLDYPARIEPFRMAFGPENVILIDYGKEVYKSGTIIPSFLRVLGVENDFCDQDWSAFFLNRSPQRPGVSAAR